MFKKPEYIVIGQFIAIIILVILLVKACDKDSVAPVVTPAKTIVAEIVKNEDSSKAITDSLRAVIEKTENVLAETKEDLQTATELVTELLNEPPTIITKEKVDSVNLYAYLEKVRLENKRKDSLAHVVYSGQQSIIENQGLQLSEKDILYSKNRALTDSLAKNQTALTGYNISLNKKLNSTKTVNKVLIGAVATLAAIVTIQNVK